MANWLTNLLGIEKGYRFGDLTRGTPMNLILPRRPRTQFNEYGFLLLLQGDISLTTAEKVNLIRSLPSLDQWQVNEMMQILVEERDKFRALGSEHHATLRRLERQALDEWKQVEACFSGVEVTVHEHYERTIHVRRP